MKKLLVLFLAIALLASSYCFIKEVRALSVQATPRDFHTFPYDENYPSGNVQFFYSFEPSGNLVEFTVYNPTKKPMDFKGAKYYAYDRDRNVYDLKFEEVEESWGTPGSLTLNPKDYITINCRTPRDPYDAAEFWIALKSGRKILYVPIDGAYKYSAWWDKADKKQKTLENLEKSFNK